MSKTKDVLVLGASGRIARCVIEMLSNVPEVNLTLYLRDTKKLDDYTTTQLQVVEGDVLDTEKLNSAVVGQDIVYANLTGDDIDQQAKCVIAAMKAVGAKRLVFVTSLGIYDEVPGKFGEWNRREIGAYLPPFRRAADAIEESGLDYTVLRPAWLTDNDEIEYETTNRNQPFEGTEVSRKSVAALIAKIIREPQLWVHSNIGVNKPNTSGDKPAFF